MNIYPKVFAPELQIKDEGLQFLNLLTGDPTEDVILVFFKLLLNNCSGVHEDIIIL